MRSSGFRSFLKFTPFILSFTLFTNAYAVNQYILTDLGTLGGNDSFAYGINNLGQVVGYANNNSNQELAFIWQNGVMTANYSWGLIGVNQSYAYNINDNSYCVGTYYSVGSTPRAYAAKDGTLAATFSGEGYAYDINNQNEMIVRINGQLQYKNLDTAAITSLGSLTTATAINDNAQVVGGSVMWDNGTFTQLGDLGSGNTKASDINNSTQVVGQSYYQPGFQHAFKWNTTDGMVDLGTIGGTISAANAINESGLIVGWARNESASLRATLWDGTGAYDLTNLVTNLTGWSHLSEARDINEQGQIVGFGVTDSGAKHAFLLTPVPAADGDLAPLGNPDGIVNAADLIIMTRLVLGTLTATPLELEHGDLYPEGAPDGIINTSDMIRLLKIIQNAP